MKTVIEDPFFWRTLASFVPGPWPGPQAFLSLAKMQLISFSYFQKHGNTNYFSSIKSRTRSRLVNPEHDFLCSVSTISLRLAKLVEETQAQPQSYKYLLVDKLYILLFYVYMYVYGHCFLFFLSFLIAYLFTFYICILLCLLTISYSSLFMPLITV